MAAVRIFVVTCITRSRVQCKTLHVNISFFWDVTPFSPLEVKPACKLPLAGFLLASVFF
jgi:hypothetical protein